MRNTFKAYERLKREQHIDTLFRKGKAFSVFPVKFIHHAVPRGAEPAPARVGFSVPKKLFRTSVDRHRLRRLMVEAWRLNKQQLYTVLPPDTQLHLFIIYTNKEPLTQEAVTEAIVKGIEKLVINYKSQAASPDPSGS